MKKYLFASSVLLLVLVIFAGAATVTSLSQLPTSSGGAFTQDNLDAINTNTTRANTNTTNLNVAVVAAAASAAAITAALPAAQSCGTTTTCAHTDKSAVIKIAYGSAALVTGSPSTAAVTGMSPAFTSAASYHCTTSNQTTVANVVGVLAAGYVSGSAVTFTGPNTLTDVFDYVCVGF